MSRNRTTQRSTEQKLQHYEAIARMTLQGKTQRQIAETLGLSQQQVSVDLKAIKKQWVANALVDWTEHLARELAKLDVLEMECWAAWDKSLQPQTKQLQHFRTNASGELVLHEVVHETTESAGNPVYLERLQHIMWKRWQLLHLVGPDALQIAVSMQQNNVIIPPELIIDDPNVKQALEAYRQGILKRMYGELHPERCMYSIS